MVFRLSEELYQIQRYRPSVDRTNGKRNAGLSEFFQQTRKLAFEVWEVFFFNYAKSLSSGKN